MQNLNIIAPIGYTGYGIAALNIIKELHKQNVNIALFPKGGCTIDTAEEQQIIQNALNRQGCFDYNAPCLSIWHQFDLAFHVGNGPHIAYPFFELNKFNDREKHHLKSVDTLIASSKWAASILENETHHHDIQVVSPGVDTTIFSCASPPKRPYDHTSKFVIGNVGKWEVRKGHDILVDIFNEAFKGHHDVELWMFPHNPFLSSDETERWQKLYNDSPLGEANAITIFPRQQTHQQLYDILQYVNVGIFPSRAEGWNMELLEFMAMGRPVIATNYSAHTEYCTADNCDLINIDEEEYAVDNKWFFGQGYWAKMGDAQIEQCITHLRARYEQWKNGSCVFNGRGTQTAADFSWEKTANSLRNILAV